MACGCFGGGKVGVLCCSDLMFCLEEKLLKEKPSQRNTVDDGMSGGGGGGVASLEWPW